MTGLYEQMKMEDGFVYGIPMLHLLALVGWILWSTT